MKIHEKLNIRTVNHYLKKIVKMLAVRSLKIIIVWKRSSF